MKVESVEAVARTLNAANVPFIVVGGVAVVAHGYGRQTHDLDLVIRLEPRAIRASFEALASIGYRPRIPITADGFSDPALRDEWITEKGMKVLNFHSEMHRETPVDVFVAEPFDFAAEYDAARVEEVAPGVQMRIVRLSTLLRMKREAGRNHDLADVSELTNIHGDPEHG